MLKPSRESVPSCSAQNSHILEHLKTPHPPQNTKQALLSSIQIQSTHSRLMDKPWQTFRRRQFDKSRDVEAEG